MDCNVGSLLVVTCVAVLHLTGCAPERKYSVTEGEVVIECDASLFPVIQPLVEDFQRSYDKARIHLRTVPAREAIANYVNDSVQYIITARELNAEEKQYVTDVKIEQQEYLVARDAVAVIGNLQNPWRELRMSMLDSIYTGLYTRWEWKRGNNVVDAAVEDVNSSSNEVFRNLVLSGKPFASSVTAFSTSEKLMQFVKDNPNAIGIVGLSWLRGHETELRVFALGSPGMRPDTTEPEGKYYPPVQAHVYRGYYPISRPVYIYSRQFIRDVGYGFISYVTSTAGQRMFLNHGLVPATMPVRLVELTSKEVR